MHARRRRHGRAGSDLRIGPALDTIAALSDDLRFDLAFIDADKPHEANYFDALLPRMTDNGIVLVDNTLWSRQVLGPHATARDTGAIRAFDAQVAADARASCVILPTGDGVTMPQHRQLRHHRQLRAPQVHRR